MKAKEKISRKITVPSDIIKAWELEANNNWTNKDVPIGVLAGGCPHCGHLCSYEPEQGRCFRCGWDYRKAKGFQKVVDKKVKNLVKT